MPAEKQKVNYQPQVPSTINGPLVHRFIPPASCDATHSPSNCVACTPNNRLGVTHNPMSFSSANCSCGVDVSVRCGAHAQAHSGPPGIFYTPFPVGFPVPGPGFGGFPGSIMQSGHRGGNIIINNGPTAAGGHIMQGAGVGGMGMGHHHHGHGHNHVYPGGTRFIQAPGSVMMARQPYLGTGGGCGGGHSGGTGPIWNGQQWVTHGLTGRDHILKMKAKADKKPQELAPADGDIKRMYEVQELDGNWTRRNRFTIDSGEIGKIRWFQRPDGSFFAKRLLTG